MAWRTNTGHSAPEATIPVLDACRHQHDGAVSTWNPGVEARQPASQARSSITISKFYAIVQRTYNTTSPNGRLPRNEKTTALGSPISDGKKKPGLAGAPRPVSVSSFAIQASVVYLCPRPCWQGRTSEWCFRLRRRPHTARVRFQLRVSVDERIPSA